MTAPTGAGAAPTPRPRPRRRNATLFGIAPTIVVIGVMAVALVVGAVAFLGLQAAPAAPPVPTAELTAAPVATAVATPVAPTAGIVFSPSTVSCGSPTDFTTTTRLPATVKAGSTVTERFDGAPIGSVVMGPAATLARLADGSWLDAVESSAARMAQVCANGGKNDEGVGVLVPGAHTVSFVDASGAVLAQGSYTVSGSAPSALPAAGGQGISFSPAAVDCSAPAAFAAVTTLPTSVKGTDTVTEKLDGKAILSATVASRMTQKADGTWAGTTTISAKDVATACAAGGSSGGVAWFAPGAHALQLADAKGAVLAQGSYSVAFSKATPSVKP